MFDLLSHHYLDDLCAKYYITNLRYHDEESKKKRCYTMVKWAYSIVYYMMAAGWACKILRESSFLPRWLGGNGDLVSAFTDTPRVIGATFEMKAFYIVQFGKHLSRFFMHTFVHSEGNYFEFILHHGLSIFLIVFSFLTNQWLIGIFVLMIHDYSDCALIIARGYKVLSPRPRTVASATKDT